MYGLKGREFRKDVWLIILFAVSVCRLGSRSKNEGLGQRRSAIRISYREEARCGELKRVKP